LVSRFSIQFLANNDICLVWSQFAELQTPPILTTDFLYLRLIGDRSIEEKDFGRIQIDRVLEMQKWADNIKAFEDERIRLAIITANRFWALGICWGCQKLSGRIRDETRNKKKVLRMTWT
jgi:hypothetical protein